MSDCSKHFNCVTPANFQPLSIGLPAALTVILGLLALIASNFVLAAASAATMTILIFEVCAYLEGGKGICLRKNVCVVGRVLSLVPVGQDKSGFEKIDDDFTFNLMVGPHPSDTTREAIDAIDPVQGPLINENWPELTSLGLGYVWSEDVTFERGDGSTYEAPALHCEIKGCRTHNVCIVLKALGIAATVAAVVCSIPVVGWVACAIAWIIVALIAIAAPIVWAASNGGALSDVMDPDSGTLTPADADGTGGDFVIVTGDLIYDAGHDGWTEIHPVRSVQKITVEDAFNGDNPVGADEVARFNEEVLARHCAEVGKATDPLVVEAQRKPANQWRIHPSIDGCKEEVVIR